MIQYPMWLRTKSPLDLSPLDDNLIEPVLLFPTQCEFYDCDRERAQSDPRCAICNLALCPDCALLCPSCKDRICQDELVFHPEWAESVCGKCAERVLCGELRL